MGSDEGPCTLWDNGQLCTASLRAGGTCMVWGSGHKTDLPSLLCFKWKETQRWGLDPSPLAKRFTPCLRATKHACQAALMHRAARKKQTTARTR